MAKLPSPPWFLKVQSYEQVKTARQPLPPASLRRYIHFWALDRWRSNLRHHDFRRYSPMNRSRLLGNLCHRPICDCTSIFEPLDGWRINLRWQDFWRYSPKYQSTLLGNLCHQQFFEDISISSLEMDIQDQRGEGGNTKMIMSYRNISFCTQLIFWSY